MQNKRRRFSAAAIIALHTVLLLLCVTFSTTLAERLPIKTYTVADGLPRDSAYNIRQDSRGFLWFCTVDGLSRFDGYAFKNFTTQDGLPERHVNDFLETRKGEIWIATDAGLAKLNPTGIPNSKDNPLFTVITPDNPKAKGIQVLFEDDSETVWIGTSDGLYRLQDGSPLREVDLQITDRDADTLSISSIIKDKQGTIWLATQNGIRRILPSGEIERYTTENGLPGDNVSVLYEDKGGRVWAGFRAGHAAGLALLVTEPSKSQNIVERHYDTKVGLPVDWITSLLETSDGKFWVATTSGLCEWQGGKDQVCRTYRTNNDLCDREVWSLTEDNDRNLWIGSQCGVKKLARYGFTSYHDSDGMDNPLANSIFENADGELFVSFNAGDRRSLSHFDGEKFKLIKPHFPSDIGYFGWGWKQTVRQDRVGDWWFPSGGGLLRYSRLAGFEDLATATPEKVEFGALGQEIFRTFEDSRGDIWIATVGNANELWHWDRSANRWLDVSSETGIGRSRIGSAFVEDKAGNLWIGTGSDNEDTGLIRYRDGRFTVFSKADNELLSGWMRDLLVDHLGRLWIASSSTGLLRLDNVNAGQLEVISYTPAQGLSSIAASCVTEDAFGRIYVGTGRGIDRLTPETGQTENFTTADGIPNSNVEVAYRDRNNTLWFATSNGLARFVPEPQHERRAPNIFITAVHVGGEALPISILGETSIPALELDASQRQLTVDFLGLGASLGENLKYEYRLNESEWTATGERTLNFANLDSSSYRFEVRAITADRIYSQPVTLAFRVAAPIWQRGWFVAAIVSLGVFLIYALYRYRLGKLVEVERIRTRIATDLHDDIGSNLTRIALLSEVANQQATAATGGNGKPQLMSSIAEIARESVASMNDIVWAISPDHDSLLDLTRRMRRHAEEVFAFRDINLDFQAPTPDSELKLSVGIRRDLLLIFKEAVSNAAKHSSCTKVRIEFRCEDSILKLRVKDNGIGFDPDSENDGNGLDSMRRRAAALGGKFLIQSAERDGTLVEFEARVPKGSQT